MYIYYFLQETTQKRGTAEEPAAFLLVRGAPSFDMSRVVGEPAGHDLFSNARNTHASQRRNRSIEVPLRAGENVSQLV